MIFRHAAEQISDRLTEMPVCSHHDSDALGVASCCKAARGDGNDGQSHQDIEESHRVAEWTCGRYGVLSLVELTLSL